MVKWLPGEFTDSQSKWVVGAIPVCTLKMFPEETVHCVEWALSEFKELFEDSPLILSNELTKRDLRRASELDDGNQCVVGFRSNRQYTTVVLDAGCVCTDFCVRWVALTHRRRRWWKCRSPRTYEQRQSSCARPRPRGMSVCAGHGRSSKRIFTMRLGSYYMSTRWTRRYMGVFFSCCCFSAFLFATRFSC